MSKEGNGFVHTKALPGEQSSEDIPMDDFATVAVKWQGTSADKQDMMMLGRSQVLRVRIHNSMHPYKSFFDLTYSETSASSPFSASGLFSFVPGSSYSRKYCVRFLLNGHALIPRF